jgi:L-ascorbate metabolism protein UlaG (beta-lactamase superfamily)
MKITYFGHSHFLIEGAEYSITLDPFSNVGLKEFETESDYVFCSHSHYDHSNFSLAKGAKCIKNGYPFTIIDTFHDEKGGTLRGKNSVLLLELDGFKVAFLGDLGEYDNSELSKKLSGVDLLFIPVGGTYTIDYKGAFNYVKNIKPKAVIPMHYHILNSTVDIDRVEPFLNEFESFKREKSPFEFNGQTGVIYLTSKQGE